jgi:hypothetical protein
LPLALSICSNAGAAEPLDAREPRYAQPAEVEHLVQEFIARQPGLDVVSISAVKCTATRCDVTMIGKQVGDLFPRLFGEQLPGVRVLSGGFGAPEVAPGVGEYSLYFEYQPLQDSSDDPTIAAKQQAACAAAWRRMTENPTPSDTARRYIAEAERRLALAAAVLGDEEARRIAAETKGRGPVIRECVPWPEQPR